MGFEEGGGNFYVILYWKIAALSAYDISTWG